MKSHGTLGFTRAASGGHTCILWKNQNSNDACIIILMPMLLQLENKVKIEPIIVLMRNHEEGKFQSSLRNSHRRENFSFCCRVMSIIIYNIDAYSTLFATYRVKLSENL